MELVKQLAGELSLREDKVAAVVKLIDEGNTIPFIARYRKEVTGSMEDTALRELEEELGIQAQREELRFIGYHEGYVEAVFWGQPFKDREVSAVYLYEKPVDTGGLILQKGEVEEVLFMEYGKIWEGIRDGSLPNCIYPEELFMIKKALAPGYEGEGVWVKEGSW